MRHSDVAASEKFKQRLSLQFWCIRELVSACLTILNDVAVEYRVAAIPKSNPGAEFSFDAIIRVMSEGIAADGEAGAVFKQQVAVVP